MHKVLLFSILNNCRSQKRLVSPCVHHGWCPCWKTRPSLLNWKLMNNIIPPFLAHKEQQSQLNFQLNIRRMAYTTSYFTHLSLITIYVDPGLNKKWVIGTELINIYLLKFKSCVVCTGLLQYIILILASKFPLWDCFLSKSERQCSTSFQTMFKYNCTQLHHVHSAYAGNLKSYRVRIRVLNYTHNPIEVDILY